MSTESSRNICVIGLGYVGLPLSIALARSYPVIGYDLSKSRVSDLSKGKDKNGEFTSEEICQSSVKFTYEESDVRIANVFIVVVPTPITKGKSPDFTSIAQASETVGKSLQEGDIVIYESTMYPGATEEICVPILERCSLMKLNEGFSVGYSPERVSPGSNQLKIENISKIISASNKETLSILKEIYSSFIRANVHSVSSIKVAEMCKVTENAQRDINIAFMNEVAILCDRLEIETGEVISAAKTKWNFSNFSPGLVGGHCIGVDPYYLTEKAKVTGYDFKVIRSSRLVNESMGKFVAEKTIKKIMARDKKTQSKLITIMGATFKENCADLRNSLVFDIYKEICLYGFNVQVVDTVANFSDLSLVYGGTAVKNIENLKKSVCLILAVKHKKFEGLTLESFLEEGACIIDVKNFFDKKELERRGYDSWRL